MGYTIITREQDVPDGTVVLSIPFMGYPEPSDDPSKFGIFFQFPLWDTFNQKEIPCLEFLFAFNSLYGIQRIL